MIAVTLYRRVFVRLHIGTVTLPYLRCGTENNLWKHHSSYRYA